MKKSAKLNTHLNSGKTQFNIIQESGCYKSFIYVVNSAKLNTHLNLD